MAETNFSQMTMEPRLISGLDFVGNNNATAFAPKAAVVNPAGTAFDPNAYPGVKYTPEQIKVLSGITDPNERYKAATGFAQMNQGPDYIGAATDIGGLALGAFSAFEAAKTNEANRHSQDEQLALQKRNEAKSNAFKANTSKALSSAFAK